MPANNEPLTEKFDSLTRIILTEKNPGKLRTACYELYLVCNLKVSEQS